jgi:RND family efflux transporter MFP subunit
MFKKLTTSLVLLTSLLAMTACNETKEKKVVVVKKAIEVKVHTLKKEVYPIWAKFSGKTQAVDEVTILARVTGELQKSFFKAGDIVKKDQHLFTIDKSKYQTIWDEKNSILEKDKASLALAKTNVKRYAPLVKEMLAPLEKLDELMATQKQFEATVKADEAALKSAKLNLEYCEVRATIDGQIGKEMVLMGNIVNADTKLAQIVKTDELYVNFNPSASEVSIIQKYKSEEKPKVKVYLKSTQNIKLELDGEIDFIDSISSTSTGTVAMRAKVFNPKKLIFPGSYVEIELLITDKASIIAVDPDQIYQNQQGQYIFVVDNNNTIRVKPINPLFSNNDMVILRYEKHKGDKVVAETLNSIKDGVKVAPLEVENLIKIKR